MFPFLDPVNHHTGNGFHIKLAEEFFISWASQFSTKPIFYIAYLIISSIQLGATVDYAILMTDRYKENRLEMDKKSAVICTISNVTVSILTSGSVLTVAGLLLGYISSNQLLAQLGIFIGRGAIFSLLIVLFVLPGLLYLFDHLVMHQSSIFVRQAKRKIHTSVDQTQG